MTSLRSTNVFAISCLSVEPSPPPPPFRSGKFSSTALVQSLAKSLLHYSSTIRTIRRLFADYSYYSSTIRGLFVLFVDYSRTIRTIRRLFADYSYYSSPIRGLFVLFVDYTRTIRTIRRLFADYSYYSSTIRGLFVLFVDYSRYSHYSLHYSSFINYRMQTHVCDEMHISCVQTHEMHCVHAPYHVQNDRYYDFCMPIFGC